MFLTVQFIYLFLSTFSFQQGVSFVDMSQVAVELSSLQFPLPDVVISTDATPNHWTFYSQDSGFPLSCSGSG